MFKFDELNNRFSDLLVNSSLISEDNTDDSDSLFKDIKACKNVTFTRSRSYFEDEVQLFPLIPVRIQDKHALLTSDEEESDDKNDFIQTSLVKSKNNLYPRSPLKVVSHNSPIAPNLTENPKRNISGFLGFSGNESKKAGLQNNQYMSTSDSSFGNKEDLDASRFIETPDCRHVGVSLTLGTISCFSPLGVNRTPLNKSSRKITKTSTPLNKAMTPSMTFKTPVSSTKTTKPQLSALKRYSIDKAIASARREFEEMARTIKLKKNILKSKTKEGNNSILDENCDSSVNSTTRNNLFCTPTVTTLCRTNEDTAKTPSMGKEQNKCISLTDVEKLDKEQTPVSSKQNLNCISSLNKDTKLLSDDDNDDVPCTQPVTAILLKDVVAYVEVRCGRDYMSEGTKAELESLGAKVEKNFTRKVTHCFFHGGKMSTYKKAIEWKVPLVSTLWIEACKAELQMLPVKDYAPHGLEKYREALQLYKLKTKGMRRAVTDSKIRQKPWKVNDLNRKATQAETNKPVPPAPTFKETDNIINDLHSVAGDLRKATNQFEKILTSPILQKKKSDGSTNDVASKTDQVTNDPSRRKLNKKLLFNNSTDNNDNEKEEDRPTATETLLINSRISDINDSDIRISYDSDDLLVYAKKQAANARSSAPSRLLTSRKCKKLLSSCKEPGGKKGEITTVGTNICVDEKTNRENPNSKPKSKSKNQPKNAGNTSEKKNISEKPATRKRKLLLLSQVIANFEQDSGESTPPASPRCPYIPTPNKKPRTGLALKTKTVSALGSAKVMSDYDSDDSLTRAARRESSALFVKKDKRIIPQKLTPTIVCTSLCRSDENVVKSIVAQLGTFTVEGSVSERTTHVITPVPRRTINLLKGIARGCWVLNVQWVYKSLEVGKWLPEEKFELTRFSIAVKVARCDRQAFGPEFSLDLFSGLGPFYVCRATVPPSHDLAELLRLGGGSVVSNARAAKIVVGSTAPLSPFGRTPPLVVKEKWVLDCITRLTQLNMNDYIVVTDSEP